MRVDWNGRELLVRDAPGSRVAVELSGHFFDEQAVDGNGTARFRIPFSPSGHPRLELMLRDGRSGSLLDEECLVVWCGHAGTERIAKPTATPEPALAPTDGDWLVPHGSDVMTQPVAVVVPVYNAADAVEACLESVLRHAVGNQRLIVIDDASSDPAIAPLLARYVGRHRVSVLRNERNLGFTATANRGIRAAGRADVVLLNADTQVAAHWLTGLRRAAHARSDIASVTAVSDNAGAFSVPDLERENGFPAGWRFDDAARVLWQDAGLAYPLLPTGNGFCLYLRRAVIDAVGVLDDVAFAQGYGEENDWCQRAEAAGYVHVIAGNVLVHHLRTQSFGIERREALGRAGMAVLRQRWPGYEDAVGATIFSFERRVLDWRVRCLYAATSLPSQRVLQLVDAASSEPARGDHWQAAIADGDVVLMRPHGESWIEVDRRPAQRAGVVASGLRHRQAIWEWLQRHGFEALSITAEGIHPAAVERYATQLGIARID